MKGAALHHKVTYWNSWDTEKWHNIQRSEYMFKKSQEICCSCGAFFRPSETRDIMEIHKRNYELLVICWCSICSDDFFHPIFAEWQFFSGQKWHRLHWYVWRECVTLKHCCCNVTVFALQSARNGKMLALSTDIHRTRNWGQRLKVTK